MKVTVQFDGEEHEVEHSDIALPEGAQLLGPDDSPEGFVPKDVVDNEVQKKVQEKTKNLRKPEEIIGDDDLFRRAAARRDIELDDDLTPVTTNEVDVDEVKQEVQKRIEREKVQPLQEQLEQKETRLSKLQDRTFKGDMLAAAESVNVKKSFRQPPVDGQLPPVVSNFRSSFAWDDEHEQWAVVDANGEFKISSKATNDNPYMGPQEFLENLRDNQAWEYMFNEVEADDTGSGGSGGGQGGKQYFTSEQIENMSEDEYAKNRDAIREAQAEGRIR